MRALFLLLLVASCSEAKPPRQPASPCHEQRFDGSSFIVCDPGTGKLRLFAASKLERPIRRFAELPVDPASVAFAMNAGMFDADGRPIGLAEAGGKAAHPVNVRDGPGNFHLKPNGVFIVSFGGGAMIAQSDRIPMFRAAPQLMTQSGPMLVIGGALHPKLTLDGTSRYVRNGVGVRGGHAWFVISRDPVSLGKFARFFRDALKTPDALYFDGSVSSLWDPANGRMDDFARLGPIIVAFRPAESAPGRGGPARP
jgi:uncharacterized protein YigE (DUF2233 family)